MMMRQLRSEIFWRAEDHITRASGRGGQLLGSVVQLVLVVLFPGDLLDQGPGAEGEASWRRRRPPSESRNPALLSF